MNILAADDEKLLLNGIVRMIREAAPDATVDGFTDSMDALESIRTNYYDVLFADISMPGLNGLELAARAKEINPKINIIFTTGYGEYIEDALWIHASGFIEKPVSMEDVEKCLGNLLYPVGGKYEEKSVRIVTFGNFMIFKNGEPVSFSRSKSKEALAFIVDRRTGCTKKEIAAALFEDHPYDRSSQKYLSNILLDMAEDLKAAGAEDILIHKTNFYSINEEKVSCDLYDYLDGKTGKNVSGEYMMQYAWAEGKFAGI